MVQSLCLIREEVEVSVLMLNFVHKTSSSLLSFLERFP